MYELKLNIKNYQICRFYYLNDALKYFSDYKLINPKVLGVVLKNEKIIALLGGYNED